MSEPVSALPGASFQGFIRVTEADRPGMVTIRADLAGAAAKSAIGRVCGVALPAQGEAANAGNRSLLWMSPDELLLMLPRAETGGILNDLSEALDGLPHLAVDMSAARVVFDLEGAALREVLAKLTPADMRPGAFVPGQVRRTRLAQVAAGIWLTGEQSARVFAFRSVAAYVFDLLSTAADPQAAVGHF